MPALNSQVHYAADLRDALKAASSWLDLGCGHSFLPDWMQDSSIDTTGVRAVGIDLDSNALRRHPQLSMRLIGDIERLPVAARSFDLITANMVVEHVEHPERLFGEVSRVLRPGGRFLVHTPNRLGYTTLLARCVPSSWRPWVVGRLQQRQADDVYPTHYRANSIDALRSLAGQSHLDVVRLRTITSSAQLYAVPVASALEEGLLKWLARERMERFRPCLLGLFEKPA